MRAGPPLFIGQIMTVFEVARPAPAGEHGMDRHDPYAAALARCIALLQRVSDIDGDRAPRLGNADLNWTYCPEHDWVASFRIGTLWLAYQETGRDYFVSRARARDDY